MIEVPPKVWTPKIVNQFWVPQYDDVDEGVFDHTPYGNCVLRPAPKWTPPDCNDVLYFDPSKDETELIRDLHFEIPHSLWIQLSNICAHRGLMPPTLGPQSSHVPSRPSKRGKRKFHSGN